MEKKRFLAGSVSAALAVTMFCHNCLRGLREVYRCA